jgi:hypothetical protein
MADRQPRASTRCRPWPRLDPAQNHQVPMLSLELWNRNYVGADGPKRQAAPQSWP